MLRKVLLALGITVLALLRKLRMIKFKYIITGLAMCWFAEMFAEAAVSERLRLYDEWMFPALGYCLIFGLLLIALFDIVSLRWRTKVDAITVKTSAFLINYPFLAIIVTGLIWAVICGAFIHISYLIVSILYVIPAFLLSILFPFLLVIKRFREEWLLSPLMLKWSIIVFLASILAPPLFIVLTNWGVLPGTNLTYQAIDTIGKYIEFNTLTHPYDSTKDLHMFPLFFILETGGALFLYLIGAAWRFISNGGRKLSPPPPIQEDSSAE